LRIADLLLIADFNKSAINNQQSAFL